MEYPWIKILVPCLVIMVGWFVVHLLSVKREMRFRIRERELKRLEDQISKVYGPIVMLRKQTRAAHSVYFSNMPKMTDNPNKIDEQNMTSDDHFIHDEITDNYLIPLNNELINIFKENAHLIDYNRIPDTVIPYLNHSYPFEIGHKITQKKKIEKLYIEQGTFPRDFDNQIEAELKRLQSKYINKKNKELPFF